MLLKNVTVLPQNVIIITKCDNFITKYDSFYKVRSFIQYSSFICKNSVKALSVNEIRHADISDPYLETSQTSVMEFFCKNSERLNSFRNLK